jgi:hypothetical protein
MTLTFKTIVPSQITVESSVAPTLGTIGDRTPIVTQGTSRPLLIEMTTVPYPDPQFCTFTRQGVKEQDV